MISEVQREKTRKSFIKYKIKEIRSQEKSIHEKECLALMINMKIGDEKTEVPGDSLSREIKEISIGAGVELTQKIIHPVRPER